MYVKAACRMLVKSAPGSGSRKQIQLTKLMHHQLSLCFYHQIKYNISKLIIFHQLGYLKIAIFLYYHLLEFLNKKVNFFFIRHM